MTGQNGNKSSKAREWEFFHHKFSHPAFHHAPAGAFLVVTRQERAEFNAK